MRRVHPVIAEITRIYSELDKASKKMPAPKPLTEEERLKGLESSRLGMSTPDDVPMTPFMSEVYKRTGEKADDKWRLKRSSDVTKAEKWIDNITESLLKQFNGPEQTDYDESLPVDAEQHYNVSCYRSWKKGVELRDIRGDQEKERIEVANMYKVSADGVDVYLLLQNNTVFQKAVLVVLNELPEVKANHDFKLVSQPFMNKDANVTYPYWKNDRAIDPATGKTYGEMSVELAKKVGIAGVYDYNYATCYGRNQKGKGRLISALSRVPNVVFNQLEHEEIEAYKAKSPLFVGYGTDEDLRHAMEKMLADCKKYGLKARNVDQSKFDMHIARGFLLLVGAMSVYKANGARSKELAFKRAVMMTKTWMINGLTGQVYQAFGRIFSGEIDTNRGGGLVSAIINTFALMVQDDHYSKIVYEVWYRMFVMGDDCLFLYTDLDYKKFQKAMEDIGFSVNNAKDEFGLYFLSWRLFTTQDGKLAFSYPWTRVLRSMLYKEQAKGLGPYGWILAAWQQLAKVRDYKPSLTILVNIIAYLDEKKLALDIPVGELLQHVREEDAQALAKLKTQNARSKFTSTADKLSDGDPQKQGWDDPDFLTRLQGEMKAVYDPDFFSKYHLTPLAPR